MKRSIILISCVLVLLGLAAAEEGFTGRPNTNNVSMPTGYTLNKGEFQVGLGPLAFGISDNVQAGTNILLYLFQDYNANIKVSFLKSEKRALALGVGFHRFDLEVFGADSPFTSVSPFVAYTTKIGANTALHMGGQYSFFSGEEDIEDAVATGTSAGTSVNIGIEHAISHKTKFLAETGWDETFKGFRFEGAVLFGWNKFRLKLGINYFSPRDTDAYIMPVVSVWWRFKG